MKLVFIILFRFNSDAVNLRLYSITLIIIINDKLAIKQNFVMIFIISYKIYLFKNSSESPS